MNQLNVRIQTGMLFVFCILCGTMCFAQNEPLTLKHAVELAQKKSAPAVIANTDQKIAEQGVEQYKSLFLPQVALGTDIGYSKGFPLTLEGSAPSLFNLNSQQSVINPSLLSFIRAAKSDARAAAETAEEKKSKIALETAQTYLELVHLQSGIQSLLDLEAAAARVEKVSEDRFHEGVDSKSEFTRAKLISAKTRLSVAQSKGLADSLRLRLSQLTGIPVEQCIAVAASVPDFPEMTSGEETTAKAVSSNRSLRAMQEHNVALDMRAQGEHRALLPTFDLAVQYSVLAKFNNYQDYFLKPFQRNNLTAGFAIRFPFLNFSQRARAETADLEALRAKKETDIAKQQVSSETLRIKNSVNQLAAARDVAKLEAELATVDSAAIQMKTETGQVTQRELELARFTEAQKKTAYYESEIELSKARLQLLQATGELSVWLANAKE
jgi:outer membrane protein TolC